MTEDGQRRGRWGAPPAIRDCDPVKRAELVANIVKCDAQWVAKNYNVSTVDWPVQQERDQFLEDMRTMILGYDDAVIKSVFPRWEGRDKKIPREMLTTAMANKRRPSAEQRHARAAAARAAPVGEAGADERQRREAEVQAEEAGERELEDRAAMSMISRQLRAYPCKGRFEVVVKAGGWRKVDFEGHEGDMLSVHGVERIGRGPWKKTWIDMRWRDGAAGHGMLDVVLEKEDKERPWAVWWAASDDGEMKIRSGDKEVKVIGMWLGVV
jgi:hypothetical protein